MTTDQQRRSALIDSLRAFGAAESDRGRRFARDHRMHPSDAAAVVEILRAEARGSVLTPARLAAQIGLSAGATSTLINRLEAAGHVVRTRDTADRRIVNLHSTSQVHKDAAAFFTPTAAVFDQILKGFPVDQLAAFTQLVEELNSTPDAHHLDR